MDNTLFVFVSFLKSLHTAFTVNSVKISQSIVHHQFTSSKLIPYTKGRTIVVLRRSIMVDQMLLVARHENTESPSILISFTGRRFLTYVNYSSNIYQTRA